ncbi:MAG TPA: phosphoglycolate phosphatase [Dongiaceae bacterium]|nr:phosphoglycolate phosphatase [Dongiaceae bacterium]
MGKPRVLVFDLDGTLIDSAPDLAQAVNALLAEFGKPPLAETTIRPMIGDGSRLLLARALAASGIETQADDVFDRFMVHYLAFVADKTKVYPDVPETLAALHAHGHPLGVCTNKPFAPTERVLEAFGLAHFFGAVIGGDSLPQRKPEPEPLWTTIERLGGGAAAMVGDSANDMLCARAAKVPGILIPSDYGLPATEADLKIARFAELPAALERL